MRSRKDYEKAAEIVRFLDREPIPSKTTVAVMGMFAAWFENEPGTNFDRGQFLVACVGVTPDAPAALAEESSLAEVIPLKGRS